MTMPDPSRYRFNIIRQRGDPKKAVLQSGHTVEKLEHVFIKSPENAFISLRCADYHNEHFVYIDPLYNADGAVGKGHWFAMCTCGSPAVIVGPSGARSHEQGIRENMLVCMAYTTTLLEFGTGFHSGQDQRAWR